MWLSGMRDTKSFLRGGGLEWEHCKLPGPWYLGHSQIHNLPISIYTFFLPCWEDSGIRKIKYVDICPDLQLTI